MPDTITEMLSSPDPRLILSVFFSLALCIESLPSPVLIVKSPLKRLCPISVPEVKRFIFKLIVSPSLEPTYSKSSVVDSPLYALLIFCAYQTEPLVAINNFSDELQ